jgi:sec-independent protein translocase protein TatC
MPLLEHLRELRSRLAKACLAVVVGSVLALVFIEALLGFLTAPFNEVAAAQGDSGAITLTFTDVTSPFTFQVRIALYAGLVLTCPIWLYQLWAFLVPGLERRERRYTYLFIGSAVPLFLGGIALGYTLLPTALGLLFGVTPAGFANLPTADRYLSFVLRMLLVFGVAFLLPVFMVLLNAIGVLPARRIRSSWRGALFGIFVFAAVASPTGDPLSLLFLAAPMCLLYVLALAVTFWLDRRRRGDEPDYDALGDDELSPLDETPSRLDDDPGDAPARGPAG